MRARTFVRVDVGFRSLALVAVLLHLAIPRHGHVLCSHRSEELLDGLPAGLQRALVDEDAFIVSRFSWSLQLHAQYKRPIRGTGLMCDAVPGLGDGLGQSLLDRQPCQSGE